MISRLGKLQTTRNLVWSKFHPIRYSDIKDESIDILLLFMDKMVLCIPLLKAKQLNTYCLSKCTKKTNSNNLRIIHLYEIIWIFILKCLGRFVGIHFIMIYIQIPYWIDRKWSKIFFVCLGNAHFSYTCIKISFCCHSFMKFSSYSCKLLSKTFL